jgi:tripartite ATP-independent transporter DctM subunit
MKARLVQLENVFVTICLGGVAVLPLAEIIMRRYGGIPGSSIYAQRLTMWVGLFGGAIAAREAKLLTLATSEFMPKGRLGEMAHILAAVVATAVATMWAGGGWALLLLDRSSGDSMVHGVPEWVASVALPVAFALIAVRLAWRSSPHTLGRIIAALGIPVGLWIGQHPSIIADGSLWPWIAATVAAAVLGAPIFTLLGGLALFLTMAHGDPPIEILIRAREVLGKSESLAAIPLFTIAGLLLAEGKSSGRLLRLLRAIVGWMPGGTAVAAATLCAFFTLFTGGSGVTILVLGGLLLPALVAERYRERFSIGLLTASGSLGLLFPLSLPLMLYGIVSQRAAIDDLFVAGLLPGLMMLGLLATLGIREGLRSGAARTPFHFREAVAAMWGARWELLLPTFVLTLFLEGITTITEAAPLAALYSLVVQRFITRDIPTWKGILRVTSECVVLVGSILLIVGVASGLTDYFVSARVTDTLVEWTTAHVKSPLVFLLGLNLFLLLVGTVMDIFSAIIVVVPLILPLAAAYDINAVRLGIIFVANLELGFLHPPLGLNLLLASVRFKKPVLEVTMATLPMLGILAIGVLLITYWPWLTMGLLHWLGRV